MSKTIIVIQARTGSSRLPNKVLMDLEGRTVLERVIERCKAADVGEVIVATTTKPEDFVISLLSSKMGVDCFFGDEDNVLKRFADCAAQNVAHHIIRITADCAMIDPRLIKDTVSYYFLTGADYCATRMDPAAYPDGMDVEIFNFNSLMFAIDGQTSKHNLEHVTPAIKETPFHNCENLPSKECYSEEIRLSLDTLEDYKLIRRIYRELYPKNPLFGLKEIMEVLEECQRDVK